jgi:signal transduction histidine kinase
VVLEPRDEKPLTLLALSDSPRDVRLLRAALEAIPDWRPELAAFEQLEAAREERTRRRADLVIIAGSPGGQAGIETLRRIREGGDDCPVLVLTGSDHEETAMQLMMAGASDCLPKSAVSSRSLKRAITNALEQHRLSQAIEDYRRELLRRDQELRRACSTLSHELKTPLTSIREFLAIVLDSLAGPLSEEQRRYLGIALESCDQMAATIHTLLDAARLETGKLPLEPVPADVAPLAAWLVEAQAPAAQEKGIRLRCVLPPDPPAVLMDEHRIAQVITNLLDNAVKFTPTGGEVALRVMTAPDHPGFVVVSVTDTGRGIERDQLDRVFDRLYQTRGSDATVHGGLGLGLSICRELVALHGGDIWVESEPGRGTTFAFTLPIHAPPLVGDPATQRNYLDEEDPGDRGRPQDRAGTGRAAEG